MDFGTFKKAIRIYPNSSGLNKACFGGLRPGDGLKRRGGVQTIKWNVVSLKQLSLPVFNSV